jgi:ATP-dependent helicase HrpB
MFTKISEAITDLPLYPRLDEILATLLGRGQLILHAEPGAGKTTLVPWRLLTHPAFAGERAILLQPRRIAARAAAERIAALLGERLGETVGLRTRLETVVSRATRLEVVTEGVLTRILQNDPALTRYRLVIFDEFHERNLPGDLAFALARECRAVFRPDLLFLFMSATPPVEALGRALAGIETLSVAGRVWPVAAFNRPPLAGESSWDGAARLTLEARGLLADREGGDLLVFLPGFREIRRTREALLRSRPTLAPAIDLLHGRLPPAEQRRVLNPPAPAAGRIILATNVAETSLTLTGVRGVVDSGLERRVRFHPRSGMDHWDTVPISEASARQRQGRAGRLGPGICLRWWRSDEPRRPFAPPEILEADLASLVLETALWGAASPLDLVWITLPPAGALDQAAALLTDLGLLDPSGRITAPGKRVAALGLHPRLGRMVLDAAGGDDLATAAVTAAILAEGDPLGGSDLDFRERLASWAAWAKGDRGGPRGETWRRIGQEAQRILRAVVPAAGPIGGEAIDPALAGKLLLSAYPDRAAQRVGGGSLGEEGRFVLVTGRAARAAGPLAQESFLVAAELDGGQTDARLFLAAPLSREDLEARLADRIERSVHFVWEGWAPRWTARLRIGRIILAEKPDGSPAEAALRQAVRERLDREGLEALPWGDAARRFLARCRFVQRCGSRPDWPDFSVETLLREAEAWLFPFGHWRGGVLFTPEAVLQALEGRFGWEQRRALDELAPETWTLPSGTKKRLDYDTGEAPVLAARLQEFFGCRQTPRIGGEPLTLHLLSPAGRPVQITRDLDGFWDRAYPEVKKELMGRYPRHAWPENPRTAPPTARTKKGRP